MRELFADSVASLDFTSGSYVERVPGGPRGYCEYYKETFGPVVSIYAALADRPDQVAALDEEFLAFATRANQGTPGGAAELEFTSPSARRAHQVLGSERPFQGVPMRVDIRLLGGFEVLVDGVPLPDDAWARQAPAALVKLLALAPGHRLRREQVIDAALAGPARRPRGAAAAQGGALRAGRPRRCRRAGPGR